MRHELYVQMENLTNMLIDKWGLIEKHPKKYKGNDYDLIENIIPYGKKKGKIEYYNQTKATECEDQLRNCFTILPRDNLNGLCSEIKGTGVTVNSLTSDRPCSEKEKIQQKLTAYRFLMMCQMAGCIRLLRKL